MRGYGGVCTFWRKEIDPCIKIIPQGNNRTLILEIQSEEGTNCLISVYMPSSSKDSDSECKEMICELNEFIETFKQTHSIILRGDMNASTQRQTSRDKLLKTFLEESSMNISAKDNGRDTFFHHNGKFTSKIDYFLFCRKSLSNVKDMQKPKLLRPHTYNGMPKHEGEQTQSKAQE